MRTIRTLGVLAVTSAALAVLPAFPAMADDTATTFTLTGGSLTYSAASTATLGNSTSGDTSITGLLGAVSVTDARGGVDGWVASGSSTTFGTAADTTTGSTSTAVAYTPGEVTQDGTLAIAAPADTSLDDTPAAIVTASAVSGNNTASWNPTLDVTLPATALADDYTGTVTTSVL
jgi:hypothetical protein